MADGVPIGVRHLAGGFYAQFPSYFASLPVPASYQCGG